MTEALIAPPGEVLFANVLAPKTLRRDDGTSKDQYSIVLLQADPEKDPIAKEFIASLHQQFMDRYGKVATYGPNGRPWKKEVQTREDGMEVPTGLVRIAFSRDTHTARGTELAPPMVQDAKGNPWPRDLAIGNGSICRVAFTTYLWDSPRGGKGISLNLLGVRVLTHVPYAMHAPEPGLFGDAEEGADVSALATAATPAEKSYDQLFGSEPSEEEVHF
jgi:hypothetical protein